MRYLFCLLLGGLSPLLYGQSLPAAPPNIIVIMADDHAVNALSCYGSPYLQTPNLDRLAREGMRFDRGYVTNSICAPSRAVLLTGKYSNLNGLRDNRDQFDGSQQTFPKLLQQAGYQTAVIGKWHLKTAPTGFDRWQILVDQGEYYNPRMIQGQDTTVIQGYTTDVITDLALDFLQKRDANKPFLLLFNHKAPHRNWMPNTKHLELFPDDLPLPTTLLDDYGGNRSTASRDADQRIVDMFLSLDMKLMPGDYPQETGSGGSTSPRYSPEDDWRAAYQRMTPEQQAAWNAHYDEVRRDFRETPRSPEELLEWKFQRYLKDYLRCIVSVDENVGRLLDYLDETGLMENTLVVYTSDQGFYLGEHGWYDKRFMYEESFRMPLLIRYPPLVKPGSVNRDLVVNIDFAPTFLDLAGVKVPTDMQGSSLLPVLAGKTPATWRKAVYYHYFEYPHGWHRVKRHYGMRDKRYKLIHFYNDIDAWELFDLRRDPQELQNVFSAPSYRKVQERLLRELETLQAYFGDVMK